jgi:NAD(P)-dependent dehydrogenase (short-subunit alcohol dehydrogenase family)
MNADARTAVIVGASRGLGLGLAAELAGRGWNVVATARQPARAQKLQALAAAHSGRLEIEALDVDRDADIEAFAQRVARRRLHLVFLNAGISGPQGRTAAQATREEVAEILWTNALAPIRIAERLLPQLVEGRTVAFMSSVLGSVAQNTSGGYDLYRISKASLNMLSRSFAAAHAQRSGITVLSLHPGWVRTDMGGPDAPVGIEESVRGLATVLESRHGRDHLYLDYQGQKLPW